MSTDEFWTLIQNVKDASEGDITRRMELLRERLMSMNETQLAAFDQHFDRALDRAFSWDLWGAAHVMLGECDDEAFWGFRSVLISSGRELFEKVVANPDNLADVPEEEEETFHEDGLQYVLGDVYMEKDCPEFERYEPAPEEPSGKEWSKEDVASMRKRWPRCFARYWD